MELLSHNLFCPTTQRAPAKLVSLIGINVWTSSADTEKVPIHFIITGRDLMLIPVGLCAIIASAQSDLEVAVVEFKFANYLSRNLNLS